MAENEEKKHKPGAIVDPGKFSNKEDLKIHFNLGSTAGAGSGDFHTYRKMWAREQKRLEIMDREWEEKCTKEAFDARTNAAREWEEDRTNKRATKRKRKKEKQKAAKEAAKLAKMNEQPTDGSFMEMFLKQQKEKEAQEGTDKENEDADKGAKKEDTDKDKKGEE